MATLPAGLAGVLYAYLTRAYEACMHACGGATRRQCGEEGDEWKSIGVGPGSWGSQLVAGLWLLVRGWLLRGGGMRAATPCVLAAVCWKVACECGACAHHGPPRTMVQGVSWLWLERS